MKQFYFALIIITCLISCTNLDVEQKQVEEFNNALNSEQIEVLELAVKSFESFLNDNFDVKLTEKEKIIEFLKSVRDTSAFRNWKFSDELNKKITEKYERSGLRKEYFHYQIEDSIGEKLTELIGQPEEDFNDDSLMNFNVFGLYMTALRNVNNPDSLILEYIDAKESLGMLSLRTICDGLLLTMKRDEYNVELLKRIIIFEIYFDLIKWVSKHRCRTIGCAELPLVGCIVW